jgi:hypothetical protein
MNLFHDSRNDRLILTQERHPIQAALLLLVVTASFVGAGFCLRESDAVVWALAVILALVGVYLLWHSLLVVTETAATFDGAARTLTIRRTRPWRVVSQTVGFDDVVDIAAQARGRWTGYGDIPGRETYYGVEITLAGERKLWMYESDEADCYAIARELFGMIRRPAGRAA